MKTLLRVLMSAVLLFPVTLLLPAHSNAESAGNTFMEILEIQGNTDFQDVFPFENQVITTYRINNKFPTEITSYSLTGSVNWELSSKGGYAFTEDKFARIHDSKLHIHDTATGKLLTTVPPPPGVNFSGFSPMYMNENYIVFINSASFYAYDTNGKFIMRGDTKGAIMGLLNKKSLILQNKQAVFSYNLSTRKLVWEVPVESRYHTKETLVPNESVIYAQGIERLSLTTELPDRNIAYAIEASTGKVLNRLDYDKYEETSVLVKDFGMMTTHIAEDVQNFHHADGKLKMSLNMETPAITQLKQKHRISGFHYNSFHKTISSQEGLYYFKRYSGIDNEYVFSSIQSLTDRGAVKFEKVLDDFVVDIATSDSGNIFLATGEGKGYYDESNALIVYDSKGNLLENIQTYEIEKLKSDGSTVYGYGGSKLYLFKESEPKKDTAPPAAPTVNAFSNLDSILTGKAEMRSTVYAYAGGKQIGEITAYWSDFRIPIVEQPGGTVIEIVAVDQAGNRSVKKTIKVLDKIAPSVPTINAVGDNAVAVTGKAESGATVHAFVGTKKLGQAVAKSGSYSVPIAKQKAGTVISVHAVDAAGNKSGSKTIKVTDKTPPAVPTVNAVADSSTAVTGKAETSATVYAYAGTKKLGETVAKNGVYSIKIAKQKAGTTISVYAVDPAKNKSGSKTVKVIDKTPPAVPTVNKVTIKSTVVSGKGEKAATVFVFNGTKKIGQGTVDSAGNFKVKITTQKKGATLKVHLQDKAGNKSGSRTVKVY